MALLLDFDPTDWLLFSWLVVVAFSALSLRMITDQYFSIVSSVPPCVRALVSVFFMCPSETDQHITSSVIHLLLTF